MNWFLAVLVVAAIGGVAVVAAGYGSPMSEEYDDRPDVRVQADGPLTGGDLRGLRFTTALRGYRASEVDALLIRLATELDGASPGGESHRESGAQEPPPAHDPVELADWSPSESRKPTHRSGPAAPADRE